MSYQSTEHEILATTKTIAVVGLSSNPMRASYEVARYMQRQGYRIIPVNPRETEVLGEKAYKTLEEIPERVDCVDVFRRAEDCLPVAEAAVKIGAKSLWIQLDIHAPEAVELARNAGLLAVDDRCLLIEHKRYMR